jgi:hypothetical protein
MRSMAKTFHDLMQGRTIKGGHFAEFDIKFTDKTTETIEVPAEKLSMLATFIQTASTVAERMRNAQPGQSISTEVPYHATKAVAGRSIDGKQVAVRFATSIGAPILVAMTPDLARRTISLLTRELLKDGKRPDLTLSSSGRPTEDCEQGPLFETPINQVPQGGTAAVATIQKKIA